MQPTLGTIPNEGGIVLKRRFFVCLLILMLLGAGAKAAPACDVPVADYIRLHVLAEDDGEASEDETTDEI